MQQYARGWEWFDRDKMFACVAFAAALHQMPLQPDGNSSGICPECGISIGLWLAEK
jgi:hypothetical protein